MDKLTMLLAVPANLRFGNLRSNVDGNNKLIKMLIINKVNRGGGKKEQ